MRAGHDSSAQLSLTSPRSFSSGTAAEQHQQHHPEHETGNRIADQQQRAAGHVESRTVSHASIVNSFAFALSASDAKSTEAQPVNNQATDRHSKSKCFFNSVSLLL